MNPARIALIVSVAALSTLAQGQQRVSAARVGCGRGCDGRIPVQSVPGNSSWRHVITEPGSYYLSDNIVGAQNMAAIRIDAPNVTIDFNGFALLGTDPGALNGIASSYDDVRLVGGGTVRDWTGGIFLGGARCRVEDMTVLDTATNGIQMLGPDGAVVRCVVGGNDWEGLHLGPAADMTTVLDCKLRDNGRHQMLVESDGNFLRRNTIAVDTATAPALSVNGSDNSVEQNCLTSNMVGEKAIDLAGDSNRAIDNTVRLAAGATLGEGIAVTGSGNEIHGGRVTVEANLAKAIRFDQPLSIIAVLVGLRPTADDSTGILGNAPGTIEQVGLMVASSDSVGIDLQGGAANVGSTLYGNRIRVAGASSTAVRSLASASIVQRNGIVLEASATGAATIDVLGSAGGHTIAANSMVLAGIDQGPILNGAGDLFNDNDILVLGDGSTAIRRVSGSWGMISDNRIRLDAANATGIFVSEFVGELVTRNIVIGQGTQFDVGEGNTQSQILVNPGNGFVAEDVVNVQVGN